MSQFLLNSDASGIYTIFSNLIRLALYALMIISMCKIFMKANEEWWKAIIPFYGTYVEYRIAGKKKLFWVYLIVSIVSFFIGLGLIISAIAQSLEHLNLYSSNYNSTSSELARLGMFFLGILVMLVPSFIINAIKCVGLAHSFGLSGGFAAGLILLPYVFYPILAFGKSQYVGEGYGYYPMNQYPQNYYNNQYSQQYPPQQYPQQYQQPYYDPNQPYYGPNQYNSYNQPNQYNSYDQYQQQNPYNQNPYTENTDIENDLDQNPYK